MFLFIGSHNPIMQQPSVTAISSNIGVGRFRILGGGARFRILGGGGGGEGGKGGKIPSRHMMS